ncbi:hypothetical protein [Fictibacillus sp. 26RED30]|nr:hypothetical protein [Fictibacillus sp. 26RED30]MBH0159859.1 hypothetical protein [Fictibacillus sp. 26RED30]
MEYKRPPQSVLNKFVENLTPIIIRILNEERAEAIKSGEKKNTIEGSER